MQQNPGNESFSIDNLILLIWPRRKPLLFISAFACVASAILSGPTFIPPKYQSVLILYPPSTNSIKTLIDKDQRFGSESDGDEYIQILQSATIRDSIIRKFNLTKHYDIDTTAEQYHDELVLMYDKNITFDRTIYNSIRIRVRDESPELAAQIANEMPKIADELRAKILYSNYHSAYTTARKLFETKLKIVEALFDSLNSKRAGNYSQDLEIKKQKYQEKKASVEALSDEISRLRAQYGVFDLEEQSSELFTQLTKAQAQFLTDSGRVQSLNQSFSEEDTTRKIALAELNGSRITYYELAKKFSTLTGANQRYTQLVDRLTIEKEILAEFEADYLRALNAFEPTINSLGFDDLKRRYDNEFNGLNSLKTLYENAYNNMTQTIPQSFVVSNAEVSRKKVYPVRWMIVLFSTLGALVLAILFFGLQMRLQSIKADAKPDTAPN